MIEESDATRRRKMKSDDARLSLYHFGDY